MKETLRDERVRGGYVHSVAARAHGSKVNLWSDEGTSFSGVAEWKIA